MDGHRFDRLTKRLAAWTSRRSFLAGAAGAAAGGLLSVRPGRAQDGTPVPDPEAVERIMSRSTRSKEEYEPLNPEHYGMQFFDPRLPVFIERLRDLIEDGTMADTWDLPTYQHFFDTIEWIPLAISVGTDADVYFDQWAIRRMWDAEPDPEFPSPKSPCLDACFPDPNETDRPNTCAASCLDRWSFQFSNATTDAERVDTFFNFVECFLLFGMAESECLASSAGLACVPSIICACRGNCG